MPAAYGVPASLCLSAGQGQRCPRPVRGTAPWVSGSRRNALVCAVDAIAAFARPPPTDEPALARHCVATHAPCTHSRRQPHRAARPGPRRHATPTRHGRAGVGARLSFSAGEAQPHSLSFRFQHCEHTRNSITHHSISNFNFFHRANFSKFLGSRRDACELLTRDAAAPTHVFTPHTAALIVPGQQPRCPGPGSRLATAPFTLHTTVQSTHTRDSHTRTRTHH